MKINEPTPDILAFHERWRVCRDVISGTHAVKARGFHYLPKAFGAQSDDEYAGYKKHVPFYPAANRTKDGIVGLMMRRDPVLDATGTLPEIKDTISSNGDSVEELAARSSAEFLGSGFYGYLTDYPKESAPSLGDAVISGVRPFVNLYDCFQILECKPGVVNNMRVPVRVRLLEDELTVRMLELVDGRAVISVYRAEKPNAFPDWDKPTEVYVPTALGKPLTELPFDLVTPDGRFTPSEPPLENVCLLNLDHYVTQGLLSTQHLFGVAPMLVFSGVDPKGDQQIAWSPGAIVKLEAPESKVYVVSVPSDAAVPLQVQLERLEDRLATVASRILARQKSVAEAAETEAVRQGAENSVLAMSANAISAKLERALKRAAAFTDKDPKVRFQINTDYLPTNISAQEIAALLGLRRAGEMSSKSLFYKLRDGGVYDETLTYEEERKRIEEVPAQQPATAPSADAQTPVAPLAPEAPTV